MFNSSLFVIIVFYRREEGENGLFITLVPKVLQLRFLIHCLNNFGDYFLILIGWVKTLQHLIIIYRGGDFVYHYWGSITIFIPSLIPLYPWVYRICVGLFFNCMVINVIGIFISETRDQDSGKQFLKNF